MHAATVCVAYLLTAQVGLDPFQEPQLLPPRPIDAKTIDLTPPTNSASTQQPSPTVDLTPPVVTPAAPTGTFPTSPTNSPVINATPPNQESILRRNESDRGAAPASAEVEVTATLDRENPALAKSLLSQALMLAQQAPIRGVPVALIEAIDGAKDRSQQLAAIRAYWRLSLALADHHHASIEFDLLSNVSPPETVLEKSLLQSAVTASAARLKEATLSAVGSQHDLAPYLSAGQLESLPIPEDPPFVGPYQTKFDDLFQSRAVPFGVRKLNDTLPRLLELIYARASAVEAARQSLAASIESFHAQQVPVSFVVDSFEKMRDQRIAFLAAIRDYNVGIAEYALNAANRSLSNHDIISMLIVVKSAQESAARPAARTSRDDRSILRSAPPTTLEPIPLNQNPVGVVPVKPAPPSAANSPASFAPSLPSSAIETPPTGDGFVPRQGTSESNPPPTTFEFDGD